jgi:hypothetical protein
MAAQPCSFSGAQKTAPAEEPPLDDIRIARISLVSKTLYIINPAGHGGAGKKEEGHILNNKYSNPTFNI